MNLTGLKRSWFWALFAVVAIILVACGDSATPTAFPTTVSVSQSVGADDLTPAEADYIEQVRAGWNEFHSKAMGFRSVFAQTYAVKARFFEALLDAGAGTAIEGAYEAVEPIIAPERFKTDQELMVRTLAEMISHDRDIGRAAENQDLAGFIVANARMGELSFLMATELTESVCRATEPPDAPFSLCNPNEESPGGEYGAELKTALARFSAGFFPRLVGFGPHFEPTDVFAAEAVLQPERADLISGLLIDLAKMQPSTDLSTDHDNLVRYFENLSDVNQAGGAAVEAQDIAKYQSEDSRGRALYCETRKDLSPDFLRITRVHFADQFGICGPVSTTSSEDTGLAEVDPAELGIYVAAVAPAFENARGARRTLGQELANPGAESQKNDVLAWFQRATSLRQQLLDSLAEVEPPVGMESLHDGFIDAVSEWVSLGARVIDLLTGAGPDFSIATDLAAHPELGVESSNFINEGAIAACNDIQRLAADNGIDTDLGCNEILG